MIGVGRLALSSKSFSAFESGCAGSFSPLVAARARCDPNAPECVRCAATRRHFLEQPGDDSVGRNHEVFDQVGRAILLLLYHIDDLIVQHQRMNFIRLQVQRAVLLALSS